ncbi:aminoacyl-tRNA hydrolase [Bacillus fonticola]|uniref:aminoacyl-tRNA hydrolase n=1 Tax=Bacillus fonticola TaxID=2728853 RepID=UPI001472CBA5|nr:aminoacyl-tRNA hydrolase [Bacillus fonticola]
MKLFVGLGNPGVKYANTRHNIGFEVIEALSNRWNIPLDIAKHKGRYGKGVVQGEKVVLLQPLTFMNLSGECVRPLMDYFDIEIDDLVVCYDDLDLPSGHIRLRQKGSAGGHNGMKSLIQHLGVSSFSRIRIGIDRPAPGIAVPNYVLGTYSKEERALMDQAVQWSVEACEAHLQKPFLEVMNEYNRKVSS